MNFHVVTLFPDVFAAAVRGFGVVGQAVAHGSVGLDCLSPREFTTNVHHTIDDRPFGGGDGMIMMAEPLAQSVIAIRQKIEKRGDSHPSVRVVHLSPRGVPLNDQKARELAGFSDLILISSRYGGADQRFLNRQVDEEISIGDYILTGGELAALVVIDAVARLKPGVLGNEASSRNETFSGSNGLLEHPQFTRPREWAGQSVPAVYMSGDHAKILNFQEALSIFLTALQRPDLMTQLLLPPKRLSELERTLSEISDADLELCGLAKPGESFVIRERLRTELARFYKLH